MTVAESWDVALKAVALAGAAMGFGVGVWQYTKAQCWRRAEWVAQEVRTFVQDSMVVSALRMIDWGDRYVQLFTDGSGKDGELVRVTDDMVASALCHHRERPSGFSKHEAAIRDAFDRYLDGIERFETFRQAGLITAADLKPHIAYWVHHIREAASGAPKTQRLVQLRAYIEMYGYVGVQQLFACFRDEAMLPQPPSDWARTPKGIGTQIETRDRGPT